MWSDIIMRYIINGLDMLIAGIFMYILKPTLPKRIWIISEREDQAQDNGIAFFKYLNEYQKQITSVYLLEKQSKEINNVQKIGKVIIKGTLKHKLYFLKSEVVASTEKNIIEPWGSRIFYGKFSKFFPKKLKVFLQHGILDKDVSEVYGKSVSDIDIFVSSTDEEKAFIKEKFGYEENEIANVGICRYDQLLKYKNEHNKENIILYMPTWRRYLFDLANTDNEYIKKAKKEFLESHYYKTIQNLLNDETLEEMLKGENLEFVFITHHGMNKLGELFSAASNNIKIYKSEDIKIAELLARSRMFITDYSSVHFDSAYIGNINLYYQFDKETFFKEHAKESYFEYERDGFGDVVKEKDELLEKIRETINTNYKRSEKYSNKVQRFFKYKDENNCERLYNLIEKQLYQI